MFFSIVEFFTKSRSKISKNCYHHIGSYESSRQVPVIGDLRHRNLKVQKNAKTKVVIQRGKIKNCLPKLSLISVFIDLSLSEGRPHKSPMTRPINDDPKVTWRWRCNSLTKKSSSTDLYGPSFSILWINICSYRGFEASLRISARSVTKTQKIRTETFVAPNMNIS